MFSKEEKTKIEPAAPMQPVPEKKIVKSDKDPIERYLSVADLSFTVPM